jgi:endonuclease YncB( thermonuclease family)
MRRGWGTAVVAVMLLTAKFGGEGTPAPTRTVTPSTPSSTIAPPALDDSVQLTVRGVLDGRTVLLSDGTQIVIDALAAPEECWAAAAAAYTKAILLDKPVRIERVDGATSGEASLWFHKDTEYALFAVGQGVLRGDAPHDPAIGAAEAIAKRTGLGLWGAPCLGQGKAPVPPASSAPATPRPTSAPAPTYGCSVTYRVVRRWQGGSHTEVRITNTGNAQIVHWALRWTFTRGETVTDTWNTTVEQSGAEVKATDVAASATIPAGGTQWLRFNATQRLESPVPRTFTLNDRRCDIGGL